MNEITLSQIFKLLIKKLWIIILVAVIVAAGTFCYFNFAVAPKYSATGSILVTNGAITSSRNELSDSKINGTDITASLSLSPTIVDILKTPEIYKELTQHFDNKYSYNSLMNSCDIHRRHEETLFIDVSFIASSKEEATELVNTFLSIATSHIMKYIPDSNANVATGADRATKVYPNPFTYALIAALVGAILTYAIAFILDSLDTTIKGEEYITSHFDIPVLGTVPDFENYGITNYSKGGANNDKK